MLRRERTEVVAEDRLLLVIMMVRYENKAARIAFLFGRLGNRFNREDYSPRKLNVCGEELFQLPVGVL